MPIDTSPDMDRVVREAAELAYTSLGMRAFDSYVPWPEQTATMRMHWCYAMEHALAYALKAIFPQELQDDGA